MTQGKQSLRWLDGNWLRDDAYVKQDGRPVLFVFGPQYFKGGQWKELRSVMSLAPLIYTLPHLSMDAGADGIFGWPPVSEGKTLSPEQWRKELDIVYARGSSGERVAAVAFPGYNDIYKQAGLHESYGHIDDRDGATFAESLSLALNSKSPLVQIATWNDYGEGTEIEPTRNSGYRYLEMIQGMRARFESRDLRLPVRLYQLRKRYAGNVEVNRGLDMAAALLFASKCREAEIALENVAENRW